MESNSDKFFFNVGVKIGELTHENQKLKKISEGVNNLIDELSKPGASDLSGETPGPLYNAGFHSGFKFVLDKFKVVIDAS